MSKVTKVIQGQTRTGQASGLVRGVSQYMQSVVGSPYG